MCLTVCVVHKAEGEKVKWGKVSTDDGWLAKPR